MALCLCAALPLVAAASAGAIDDLPPGDLPPEEPAPSASPSAPPHPSPPHPAPETNPATWAPARPATWPPLWLPPPVVPAAHPSPPAPRPAPPTRSPAQGAAAAGASAPPTAAAVPADGDGYAVVVLAAALAGVCCLCIGCAAGLLFWYVHKRRKAKRGKGAVMEKEPQQPAAGGDIEMGVKWFSNAGSSLEAAAPAAPEQPGGLIEDEADRPSEQPTGPYLVRAEAPVAAGVPQSSAQVGAVEPGAVVEVLEARLLVQRGIVRGRIAQPAAGWLSICREAGPERWAVPQAWVAAAAAPAARAAGAAVLVLGCLKVGALAGHGGLRVAAAVWLVRGRESCYPAPHCLAPAPPPKAGGKKGKRASPAAGPPAELREGKVLRVGDQKGVPTALVEYEGKCSTYWVSDLRGCRWAADPVCDILPLRREGLDTGFGMGFYEGTLVLEAAQPGSPAEQCGALRFKGMAVCCIDGRPVGTDADLIQQLDGREEVAFGVDADPDFLQVRRSEGEGLGIQLGEMVLNDVDYGQPFFRSGGSRFLGRMLTTVDGVAVHSLPEAGQQLQGKNSFRLGFLPRPAPAPPRMLAAPEADPPAEAAAAACAAAAAAAAPRAAEAARSAAAAAEAARSAAAAPRSAAADAPAPPEGPPPAPEQSLGMPQLVIEEATVRDPLLPQGAQPLRRRSEDFGGLRVEQSQTWPSTPGSPLGVPHTSSQLSAADLAAISRHTQDMLLSSVAPMVADAVSQTVKAMAEAQQQLQHQQFQQLQLVAAGAAGRGRVMSYHAARPLGDAGSSVSSSSTDPTTDLCCTVSSYTAVPTRSTRGKDCSRRSGSDPRSVGGGSYERRRSNSSGDSDRAPAAGGGSGGRRRQPSSSNSRRPPSQRFSSPVGGLSSPTARSAAGSHPRSHGWGTREGLSPAQRRSSLPGNHLEAQVDAYLSTVNTPLSSTMGTGARPDFGGSASAPQRGATDAHQLGHRRRQRRPVPLDGLGRNSPGDDRLLESPQAQPRRRQPATPPEQDVELGPRAHMVAAYSTYLQADSAFASRAGTGSEARRTRRRHNTTDAGNGSDGLRQTLLPEGRREEEPRRVASTRQPYNPPGSGDLRPARSPPAQTPLNRPRRQNR